MYSAPDGDDVIGALTSTPTSVVRLTRTVRSWVRASHADRDLDLAVEIDQWLREVWPLRSRRWPGRPALGS